MLNLFSDSVHVTIDDIHFIVGPNITNVSKDHDFQNANSHYDTQNPIENLKKMFMQCDKEDAIEKAAQKEKKKEEKQERALKRKETRQERDQRRA